MREDEIKTMIKDIVNNDAVYEYCPIGLIDCEMNYNNPYPVYSDWKLYKLGDPIYSDCVYRKIEKWNVVYTSHNGKFNLSNKFPLIGEIVFKGTKEECELFIEDNKSFLEKLNSKISPNAKNIDFKVKETAERICEKILTEAEHVAETNFHPMGNFGISVPQLKDIIKKMGIGI